PSGATLIVARGVIPTTTPDRFRQANHNVNDQGCKNGGDHRFFYIRRALFRFIFRNRQADF
ncbi:hypothetical protein AB4Y43_32335, partial [Paraburkholderia sp. BR10872]|uniref:hypothetical protein n=1 Tax=Paraburkholderia sp. BR10872 TaxID=3236989 RepID=UPI0034D1EC4C